MSSGGLVTALANGTTNITATSQGKTNTHAAREAFNTRFIREVDPEGVLPEAERQKRAEKARELYFLRLTKASKDARARKVR